LSEFYFHEEKSYPLLSLYLLLSLGASRLPKLEEYLPKSQLSVVRNGKRHTKEMVWRQSAVNHCKNLSLSVENVISICPLFLACIDCKEDFYQDCMEMCTCFDPLFSGNRLI
jgi:hypothetical protein